MPEADTPTGFAALAAGLRRRHAAEPVMDVVVRRSVRSTNELARRIRGEYNEEGMTAPTALVVAWEQTAGRGRQGRSWASPAGKGLYASLLVRVRRAHLERLPVVVPLIACEVLDRYADGHCTIKWPNDVLIDGRKVAGVLIETAGPEGAAEVDAVIGLGVNTHHRRHELPTMGATSLCLESEGPVPLDALAWQLGRALLAELSRLEEETGLVARYGARLAHRRGDRLRCRVGGAEVDGVFRGLDSDGHLRLEVGGEVRTLRSGEVVEG